MSLRQGMKGVGAEDLCKSEDGSDLPLPDDSRPSPFGEFLTLFGGHLFAPPHAVPSTTHCLDSSASLCDPHPPAPDEAFQSLTPSCQLLYSAN